MEHLAPTMQILADKSPGCLTSPAYSARAVVKKKSRPAGATCQYARSVHVVFQVYYLAFGPPYSLPGFPYHAGTYYSDYNDPGPQVATYVLYGSSAFRHHLLRMTFIHLYWY
jgi:hypothetical protein